jgi:lipoprotein NlpI
MNEMDKAIDDFNRALERDPEMVWAYFNRGLALFMKGEDARAQADFQKVSAMSPELMPDLERRIELARTIRPKK